MKNITALLLVGLLVTVCAAFGRQQKPATFGAPVATTVYEYRPIYFNPPMMTATILNAKTQLLDSKAVPAALTRFLESQVGWQVQPLTDGMIKGETPVIFFRVRP